MNVFSKAYQWLGFSSQEAVTTPAANNITTNTAEPFTPPAQQQDTNPANKPLQERQPGKAYLTVYLQAGGVGHASLKLETDHDVIHTGKYPGGDDDDDGSVYVNGELNEQLLAERIEQEEREEEGSWVELVKELPTMLMANKAELMPETPLDDEDMDSTAHVTFELPAEKGEFLARQLKNAKAYCDGKTQDNKDHDVCQYRFLGNNCVDYVQHFYAASGLEGNFADHFSDEQLAIAASPSMFYARPNLTTLKGMLAPMMPEMPELPEAKTVVENSPSLDTLAGGLRALLVIGYAVKKYREQPKLKVSDTPVTYKTLKNSVKTLHKQSQRIDKSFDRLDDRVDKDVKKALIDSYIEAAFALDDLERDMAGGNHSPARLKEFRARMKPIKKELTSVSKKLQACHKSANTVQKHSENPEPVKMATEQPIKGADLKFEQELPALESMTSPKDMAVFAAKLKQLTGPKDVVIRSALGNETRLELKNVLTILNPVAAG